MDGRCAFARYAREMFCEIKDRLSIQRACGSMKVMPPDRAVGVQNQ